MDIKETINQSIKDLENFQASVNQQIDNLSVEVRTKQLTVAPTPTTNSSNITLVTIIGGLALVSGLLINKESDMSVVKTPLVIAGLAGFGYAAYQKFGKSQIPNPATPDMEYDWNAISTSVRDKFNQVLNYKEDFRNLITQNRDNILEAIDKEITDFDKKQGLNKIAHYREVPSISYSDYTIDVNNSITAKNKTNLDQTVSKFKSDAKKALEKAIENQKEKYNEILKEL